MLSIFLTGEVKTGNQPYTATLFKVLITDEYIPIWHKAGVYDMLYTFYDPKAEILADDVVDVLIGGLVHMCSSPEEYAELYSSEAYPRLGEARTILASIIRTFRKYPSCRVSTVVTNLPFKEE